MTSDSISPRLLAIIDALPLRANIRVLEIGCGPGTAARAIANRIENGHVLAIDRSTKAIALAKKNSQNEIRRKLLTYRQAAVEDFVLEHNDAPYDIAFAIRVGALDGRHPELQQRALQRIAAALGPNGRLFIDGGDPLRELQLEHARVSS